MANLHLNFNTTGSTDRFIPLRNEIEWNNKFNMENNTPDLSTPKKSTRVEERKIMYECLLKNEILKTRICDIYLQNHSFKGKSAKSENLFSFSDIRTPLSVSSSNGLIISTNQKLLRYASLCGDYKLPARPQKILDAPNLRDDFYLNVLDWSIKNVLSVALGSSVYLWLYDSDTNISLFDTEPIFVSSVAWNEEGSLIACGDELGRLKLWDPETKIELRSLKGHDTRVNTLCWNGSILTSAGNNIHIFSHDIRVPSRQPVQKYIGHTDAVCGLKWSETKQYLASGGNDNKVFIWDKRSKKHFHCFHGHNSAVKALAWSSHKNDILASGGGNQDRKICIWNVQSGKQVHVINTGSQVCNLTWSNNSKELISTHGIPENNIAMWSYPNLIQIASLCGHTQRVLYLTMSPNKTTIATAGGEDIRFWHILIPPKTLKTKRSMLNLFNVK
jgi:cell division cycle 20-like protein 1 (cofactor of APC complex)